MPYINLRPVQPAAAHPALLQTYPHLAQLTWRLADAQIFISKLK